MRPREIIRQVTANWSDPEWWHHVAAPFALRTGVLQPYYRHISPIEGDDFMAEEWDNLIILDACRFDLFAFLWDGPGQLEWRRSPGSNTPEFLAETFGGRRFDDVVYVTANPQVNLHAADAFHEIVDVWDTHWDDDLNTVPPSAMAEATLSAYEQYPDKRLIAHFVQPHYPFIGEYARENLAAQAGIELSRDLATRERRPTTHDHVWLRIRRGTVDPQIVRRAYRENLALTIPHVKRILEAVDEPTVVTADHGNSFGARATPLGIPVWGHPRGVKIPELVRVPWLTVPGAEQKDVVPGDTPDAERRDPDVVDERLRDLGYVT